ncbi:MAG TPA: hypothetical protein VGR98_28080 [Streptosporangiaceae bacterium]|nr:hypothetical protein [Streptosporangiaceae bacterium]
MEMHRHDPETGAVILEVDDSPSGEEAAAHAAEAMARHDAEAQVEVARIEADAVVQLAKIERQALSEEERIELEALRAEVETLRAQVAPEPEPAAEPVIVPVPEPEPAPADDAPPVIEETESRSPRKSDGFWGPSYR